MFQTSSRIELLLSGQSFNELRTRGSQSSRHGDNGRIFEFEIRRCAAVANMCMRDANDRFSRW
jgi:hypothetical protein